MPCLPALLSLQLLFDFVDSKGASGMQPGSYSLVQQFPRRQFLPEAAAAAAAPVGEGAAPAALGAAGLGGPRQVLFLEPLPSPGAAPAAPAIA